MCVAAAPARFDRTIVYVGEGRRGGMPIHVVGYENMARSLAAGPPPSRTWWRRLARQAARPQTGNAMLLHFPAVPGSMTQENLLDTESCPAVLTDMVKALAPPTDGVYAVPAAVPTTAAVEVFESGIYTVVLATDARAIPAALDRVPKRKRPPHNAELFAWYHATFPGWPVALCCFDNTERKRATPMLWWYEPAFPHLLFAPAIDAHTGGVPDLRARVAVDHWVIAGSAGMAPEKGQPVWYTDRLPTDVAALLPNRVIGRQHRGVLPNGDFVVPVEAVRAGRLETERRVLTAAG